MQILHCLALVIQQEEKCFAVVVFCPGSITLIAAPASQQQYCCRVNGGSCVSMQAGPFQQTCLRPHFTKLLLQLKSHDGHGQTTLINPLNIFTEQMLWPNTHCCPSCTIMDSD